MWKSGDSLEESVLSTTWVPRTETGLSGLAASVLAISQAPFGFLDPGTEACVNHTYSLVSDIIHWNKVQTVHKKQSWLCPLWLSLSGGLRWGLTWVSAVVFNVHSQITILCLYRNLFLCHSKWIPCFEGLYFEFRPSFSILQWAHLLCCSSPHHAGHSSSVHLLGTQTICRYAWDQSVFLKQTQFRSFYVFPNAHCHLHCCWPLGLVYLLTFPKLTAYCSHFHLPASEFAHILMRIEDSSFVVEKPRAQISNEPFQTLTEGQLLYHEDLCFCPAPNRNHPANFVTALASAF